MKSFYILFIMLFFACHTKDAANKTETVQNDNEIKPISEAVLDPSVQCGQQVCLKLINHDAKLNSFDIYMRNSIDVAGFQCDFSGINIVESDGGLLKSNEYQTKNSLNRILSFSMQAKLIRPGEGILTTIKYSDLSGPICMTDIIFAGMNGQQISNNNPDCITLN